MTTADIIIVIILSLIVCTILFFYIRAKVKGKSHCDTCAYAKNCDCEVDSKE